jgi:hypothetical protein
MAVGLHFSMQSGTRSAPSSINCTHVKRCESKALGPMLAVAYLVFRCGRCGNGGHLDVEVCDREGREKRGKTEGKGQDGYKGNGITIFPSHWLDKKIETSVPRDEGE